MHPNGSARRGRAHLAADVSAPGAGVVPRVEADLRPRTRPPAELPDRVLRRYLAALAAAVVVWYVVRPLLPGWAGQPGSPVLHAVGVLGALLLLSTLLFPYVKRLRQRGGERAVHHWHILAGATGAALVLVHASGYLAKAPGLLVLAVLGLVASGTYGRLVAARLRYLEFAGDAAAFGAVIGQDRQVFTDLARAKTAVLARLEPSAAEATFGLNLEHWIRRPRVAWEYWRLACAEERLVTNRRTAPASRLYQAQRTWRLAHIALVTLLVVGLGAHVVTVTFFAGYAAEAGEVYWWYLRR